MALTTSWPNNGRASSLEMVPLGLPLLSPTATHQSQLSTMLVRLGTSHALLSVATVTGQSYVSEAHDTVGSFLEQKKMVNGVDWG